MTLVDFSLFLSSYLLIISSFLFLSLSLSQHNHISIYSFNSPWNRRGLNTWIDLYLFFSDFSHYLNRACLRQCYFSNCHSMSLIPEFSCASSQYFSFFSSHQRNNSSIDQIFVFLCILPDGLQLSRMQDHEENQSENEADGQQMWPFVVRSRIVVERAKKTLRTSLLSLCSIRCENCLEKIFSKGLGLCPTCKTELKKANFRPQVYEDPAVEMEIDIRKRLQRE